MARSSQIGSVEFAVERFGTRVVVVLGHSECGAVSAALDVSLEGTQIQSPHLRTIADRIRPPIESTLAESADLEREVVLERAVRANVVATVDTLLAESPLLSQRTLNRELRIVGAEYSLESGVVEFLGDEDGISGL